jgi:hypothetical protein
VNIEDDATIQVVPHPSIVYRRLTMDTSAMLVPLDRATASEYASWRPQVLPRRWVCHANGVSGEARLVVPSGWPAA